MALNFTEKYVAVRILILGISVVIVKKITVRILMLEIVVVIINIQ